MGVTTFLSPGFRARLGKLAEIGVWQVGTKIVSIFAFAHAARVLGPEKFGISGVVLSVLWQITTVSGLLNEVFLSRRYRRARSEASRHRLVAAATAGRFVLALAACIPVAGLGLLVAPGREWWVPILIAVPFTGFVFLQPNWILIGSDRANVIWRTAGIGSLVTSAALFSCRGSALPAGSDIFALALGAGVCLLLGWYFCFRGGAIRFRLSRRSLRMASRIVVQSRWLFLIYLFGNIYLYSDAFLLGVFGSTEDAGLYRPASALAASIFQSAASLTLLLFPKLLDWARDPALLWKRQLQIGGIFLALGGVGMIPVFFLSETLFLWMYGEEYVAGAGPFVLILAARGLAIVGSIFTYGMISANRDRSTGAIFLVAAFVTVGLTVMLIPRIGIWAPAIAGFAGDAAILLLAVWGSWRRYRTSLV